MDMIIITIAIIDLLFLCYTILLNYDEIVNDLPNLIYIENQLKDEKNPNEKKDRNRQYYLKNRERLLTKRRMVLSSSVPV